MSFASQLNNFEVKTTNKINKLVRKVVIDMGTRVVIRTAVGNPILWKNAPPSGYSGGRARANWQYGNGVMPNQVLELIDGSGSLTIAKLESGVNSFKAASVHWFANNLPYIKRLEEGTLSKQSPQGMVRITVAEFEDTVSAIAKELQ